MSQAYIPVELRRQVSEAACYRCGYCLTAQRIIGMPLHFEHLFPLALGGKTAAENLWLACPLCNGYKGIQTQALDPVTEANVPLFNPRLQTWHEHFEWSEDATQVIGKTAVGRATVLALRLNNEYVVPARRVWVAAGWHPPVD